MSVDSRKPYGVWLEHGESMLTLVKGTQSDKEEVLKQAREVVPGARDLNDWHLAGLGLKSVPSQTRGESDVDAPSPLDGKRAAHYAARFGDRETILAIARAGGDFEAPDRSGKTPLHEAALSTNPQVACAAVKEAVLVARAAARAREAAVASPASRMRSAQMEM